MIRDSMYFSYAGKKSSDFGIINVTIGDNMMLEEPLASSREILEESIKGSTRPYFQGMKKSPFRFSVSFAFEDTWDTDKIREVARWLTEQDYYKELYFSSDPERIFYAIVVDEPTLVHNSLSQGYMNLTFRCDSPYSYSPTYLSPVYEWRESLIDSTMTDFSKGTKKALKVQANGSLVLDSTIPKWSDYLPGTKWSDIS
ncbi:phage-like protein [Paenibacillus alvei TS-15]|uniref:Phage-like protein n=1 Tax=Paenibacillus alvei TS-15 TaxID=1117108 RepID=S9SHP8_PAEAL|nr:distal tail protein Dit [Paenibacillus alvei]EPY05357.1 phage-like protein [Paenibacillus alvei TS-15]